MSTEYSQAVRDVVRAIGEHGWDRCGNLRARNIALCDIQTAIADGLVYEAKWPFNDAYSLTSKGHKLARKMLQNELEEVVASAPDPKLRSPDKIEFEGRLPDGFVYDYLDETLILRFKDVIWPEQIGAGHYRVTLTRVEPEPAADLPVAARSDKHEFRAQVSGHEVFKSAEIVLRSTDGALFSDRTFLSREYNVTLTPVEPETETSPSWDGVPEWVEWMAQDEAGLWCGYENYPLLGSEAWWRDDGQACIISFHCKPNPNWKDTLQPRPEPAPDPLCPVCDKPASEHKSGLYWKYTDHASEQPCSVCGSPASEHQDGLFCCPHCGGEVMIENKQAVCQWCHIGTILYGFSSMAASVWNRRALGPAITKSVASVTSRKRRA